MADNDISISGSGKINGGEYGKILISGSGAIVGGIRCEEIRVSGSASADGEINCSGDVKIAGSFKCKGKLSAAGELKIAGSCRTDGEVVGNVIKIAGSFCSGGKIVGKEIKGNTAGCTANAFAAHMLASIPSYFTNFFGRGANSCLLNLYRLTKNSVT